MKLIANLSLQKKIILLMLILYLPLPLLGQFWYEKSHKVIRQNTIESSYQLVEQVNRYVDRYFQDIEHQMYPILVNDLTLQFLNDSVSGSYDRFLRSNRIERELLNPLTSNREGIRGISLVNGEGRAVSSSSFSSAERRYKEYNAKITKTGVFEVMGLEQDEWSPPFLSIALKFNSTSYSTNSGLLIIDLKLDEVIQIARNVRIGKTGYVWIADSKGSAIYRPGSHPNEGLSIDYAKAMGDKRQGTLTMPGESGDKLVMFFHSNTTGMSLFAEVPLAELNEPLLQISRISTIVLLLIFLLIMIIVSGVMYMLSNSLLTLLRLMKRTQLGELGVRAPENRTAEIGSLYRGFNKMVDEIQRLIDTVHRAKLREKELEVKQKEALLLAMQAQIHPHFLYNTLEFINASAIVEGNRKISRMIVSLGDMFRYSVRNPNETVTLALELGHVSAYLSIQAERYESLSYFIQVSEKAAAQTSAINSMLQPIVENCFKHGFDKYKIVPNYIRISEMQVAAGCLISIEDGGGGMPPVIMDNYNRLFDLSGDELLELEAENKQKGIGLLNVHTRLRLLFGEPYGLFISTSGPDGTCIDILLPTHIAALEQEQQGGIQDV
ncbi:cache domain-containing sensor histidine kinase [Paenibacillus agri]|uniref:Histidine kinase n=1 Tax=Paenibacillus agri TaxID=2744309 RepID=A0A850ESL6_9BACL|nr:histidine kinase [Paenibacillus agri]NUU62517.1 histidine kinase [Paenibacillus agri]